MAASPQWLFWGMVNHSYPSRHVGRHNFSEKYKRTDGGDFWRHCFCTLPDILHKSQVNIWRGYVDWFRRSSRNITQKEWRTLILHIINIGDNKFSLILNLFKIHFAMHKWHVMSYIQDRRRRGPFFCLKTRIVR